MWERRDYKKVRLYGPPKGASQSRWKGATTQRLSPSVQASLIRRLTVMRDEGVIGSFRCLRVSDGVSVWIGRAPKKQRPPCGARTRKGTPCKAKTQPDSPRCRIHGGLSTGPKTEEGRERIRESNRRRAALKRAFKEAQGDAGG